MAKARVSAIEHKAVKRALAGQKFIGRGEDSYRIVAANFERSLPTIMRIHSTKNHDEYLALVRSEHPARVRRSLHERFKTQLAVLLNKEIISQADYDYIEKGKKYEPDTD